MRLFMVIWCYLSFPKWDLESSCKFQYLNHIQIHSTYFRRHPFVHDNSCLALSDFESAEFDTKAHRESGYPVMAGSPPAESRMVYAKGRVPSSSMNPERIARWYSVILRHPTTSYGNTSILQILRDPPWSSCPFQDIPRCSKAPTRGVGRCSKIHWSNRVAMALAVMPCQRARTRSYRVRMGTVSKDGCLSGCWPLLLKAIKTAQIPRLDFDKSERQMQNTRQSACVQYTWTTAIYIYEFRKLRNTDAPPPCTASASLLPESHVQMGHQSAWARAKPRRSRISLLDAFDWVLHFGHGR